MTTATAKQCPYCGREDEGNAGDYYHQKRCEQTYVRNEIKLEEGKKEPNQGKLRKLRRELERAYYVGD